MVRGRIRLDHGFSGIKILRFASFERFTHWLTASCFIVLALSGLNISFGRLLHHAAVRRRGLRDHVGLRQISRMTIWRFRS